VSTIATSAMLWVNTVPLPLSTKRMFATFDHALSAVRTARFALSAAGYVQRPPSGSAPLTVSFTLSEYVMTLPAPSCQRPP
jgi:hypothetical protein